MRILYLVIHTQKQQERYDNIMQTWGIDVDVLFYSDHEMSPNIIKVSELTDYSSGEDKQINIINNFPENKLNYDWYVFVDNDSFINTDKVSSEIYNFDENFVHGQVSNTYHQDPSLFYCLGGAGIFVSNKILNLMKGRLNHNNVVWGDVSLGMNMKKLNIKLKDNNLCHSQLPGHYNIQNDEIKNNLTFHYVKDLQTLQLYSNLCKNNI